MNNNKYNNRSDNNKYNNRSDNMDKNSTVNILPNSNLILPSGNNPTYKKNMVFYDVIKDFSVKDKRKVFAEMRTTNIKVNIDTFFPQYGLTAGEFSTWAILTENNRKKR